MIQITRQLQLISAMKILIPIFFYFNSNIVFFIINIIIVNIDKYEKSFIIAYNIYIILLGIQLKFNNVP